jgi:hypothetical protein
MRKKLSLALRMQRRNRTYIRSLLLVAGMLLWSGYCMAQFELSSGIDLSYPLLLNKYNSKPNYGQISFGIRFGVAYKPPETQFFPILNISTGRTRLPLLQLDKNVVALNFNYINVMANENYVVRGPKSELYIYGGVGFSYLNRKSLTITGPGGEQMKTTIDSTAYITKTFPAVNLGFEYNYGESAGKDLYLTMGLNFQYIMLLNDRNSYFMTVKDATGTFTPHAASISGNLITPSFYIAIHYLLHHSGKSKMYL